jgi:hypothetical protein
VTDAPEALHPGAMCAVHADRRAERVCARCGTYACDECTFSRLRGKEICRACAALGLTDPLPWEQRKELGWWRAFWGTVKLVMFQPSVTFRTPQTEDSLVGPILFGAIAYTFGQLVVMLIVLAMFLIMGVAVAASTDQPGFGAIFAGYGLCMVPFTLLQAPVYALIGILFSGSLGHLTLVALKRARAPFDQSIRAVAYANAPHVLEILSCVVPFWVITAETIALRETHRCTTGTALLATLGWRLLFIGLIVGAYATFIAVVVMSQPSR